MPKPPVSQATEDIYSDLTPLTEEDEDNNWHLILFLEAIMATLVEDVRAWVADRDNMPGWAVLLNVDEAPGESLPWLAQFIGAIFTVGMSEEDQRLTIKTPNNHLRGRTTSIVKAAQRTLTGTQVVYVKERFGFNEDHAYRLFIRTYDSQTPDEDAVRADILTQKPGGIRLDYESIPGQTYNQLKEKVATYNDLKAAYATYDEAAIDF